MKRPAVTQLAGGAASAPLASLLTSHGTTGLTLGAAVITAGLLIGAVVPELPWLLLAILAARHQIRLAARASGTTREKILTGKATNPIIEIARVRAQTGRGPNGPATRRNNRRHR
jgi:hypothetical protein